MNENHIREILKDLEERNNLFIQNYNKRLHLLRRLMIGTVVFWLMSVIHYINFLIATINDPELYDVYKYDFSYPALFLSILVVHQFVISKKIPEQSDKRNHQKIWLRLRVNFIFDLILYFFILIFSFLWRPVGTIAISFIVITFVTYFTYVLTVIIIKINPKLILSGLLNQIGSTCYYLAFLSYGYYALFSALNSMGYADSIQIKIIVVIIVTIIIVIAIFVLMRVLKIIGLMPTQFDAIKIIKPSRLIVSLRTEEAIVNDKGRAIELLKEIKQDVGYGIQSELVKLIVREHTTNKKKIIGPLIPILIAILTFISISVGRAFVQDFIYHGYLKEILCNLFERFC